MTRKYLDFEIIKESWDTYSLQDGTKLKARFVLKSAWIDQTDKADRRVELDLHQAILCDPSMQGKPDSKQYTPEQMSKYVEVKHCKYTTMQYEPSEYILDDGSRLLVHCTIANISRTTLFDAVGNRIYLVRATGNATVTPP